MGRGGTGVVDENTAPEQLKPEEQNPEEHEHAWDEGEVTKEATCSEAGVKTYTCTDENCLETKTEAIDATGEHQDGDGDELCDICKVSLAKADSEEQSSKGQDSEEQKPEEQNPEEQNPEEQNPEEGTPKEQTPEEHEHAWDEGEVTEEATCSKAGVMTYTCTGEGCTETKTEDIAATGEHQDEDKNEVCDVCGACLAKADSEAVQTFLAAVEALKNPEVKEDASEEEMEKMLADYRVSCENAKALYNALTDGQKMLEAVEAAYDKLAAIEETLELTTLADEVCPGGANCKHEAAIGETHYDTLQEAIKGAKEGDTITLLKNLEENNLVSINKKIILDLNGKTITGKGDYTLACTQVATIQNGTVINDKNANNVTAAIYAQNTVVTVEDVTIKGANTGIACGPGVVGYYGGAIIKGDCDIYGGVTGVAVYGPNQENATTSEFKLEGGKISGGRYGIAGNGSFDGTNITLQGGTVTGNQTAIYHPQQGTLTVPADSTVVVTGLVGLQMCGGTANIAGGDFVSTDTTPYENPLKPSEQNDGTAQDGAALSILSREGYGNVTANVTGGTFTAQIGNLAVRMYGFAKVDGVWTASEEHPYAMAAISGGTFSTAVPADYCAEGFVPTQDENGKYTVITKVEADAVAVVASGGNTVFYPTLQEAIAAAKNGGTVTLLKNITEDVTVEGNVTLDLNGKTLTGAGTKSAAIINEGTLTITDSANAEDESKMGTVVGVNKDSKPKSAVINEVGAVCTIAGGRITRAPYLNNEVQDNTSTNSNYTVQNKGEMYITGGLIVNNSSKSSMVVNLNNQGGGIYGQNQGVKMVVSGGTLRQDTYTALKNDPNSVMEIQGSANIISNAAYVTQFYGDVTISGGSFSGGQLWACSHADAKGHFPTNVNITGGSIAVSEIRAIYGYTTSALDGSEKVTVKISGDADVTCPKLSAMRYDGKECVEISDKTMSDIAISGGTFSTAVPADYCAEGFVPTTTPDGNGKYTVITKAEADAGNTGNTGDTTGGDTTGGNTSGGDTTGGNTSGGDTTGGNTSGGSTTGGTSGSGTTGGTSGGSTTGGGTSGSGTPGGGTSDDRTSGDGTPAPAAADPATTPAPAAAAPAAAVPAPAAAVPAAVTPAPAPAAPAAENMPAEAENVELDDENVPLADGSDIEGTEEETEAETEAEPETETVNLEDEETPLAAREGTNWALFGIIPAALAAMIIFFLILKRKKEKEEAV